MSHHFQSSVRDTVLVFAALVAFACGSDDGVTPPANSGDLVVAGSGTVPERYTAEINVRGNIAYTTTWGFRSVPGNAVKIWNVAGDIPTLVDSVIVSGASTLGDVQVSDDGQLLIVATEFAPGSIAI